MALIKCTECGAQISDRARKCPSCGCPIEEILKEMSTQDEQKIIKEADDPKQSRKKRKNGIIIVGAAVLVVILVVVFFNFFNMRKINLLDYTSSIGTLYSEHEDIKFEKNEAWSIMVPEGPFIYEGKTELTFIDIEGELEYRYMDGDEKNHKANEIYFVCWTSPEDEDVIINDAVVQKLIKGYDKLYGEHNEEEDEYVDAINYIWHASNDVEFQICVYKDQTDISLRWILAKQEDSEASEFFVSEDEAVSSLEVEKISFIESFLGVEVIDEQACQFKVNEEQQNILNNGIKISDYMGRLELSDLTTDRVDNGVVTAIYWYSDDTYSHSIYDVLISILDNEYGEHNTIGEDKETILSLFQKLRNEFEGKNESSDAASYGELLYHWSRNDELHIFLSIDKNGRMLIFWYSDQFV